MTHNVHHYKSGPHDINKWTNEKRPMSCPTATDVTQSEINESELVNSEPHASPVMTNDTQTCLPSPNGLRTKASSTITRVSLSDKAVSSLQTFLAFMSGSFECQKSMNAICKLSVIFWCVILAALPSSGDAFCAPGCTCDDLVLSVRCTNASLAVIPYLLNPEVKYLKLLCNNIESVGQSLAFYPQITTLDLGHNVISSLEDTDFEAQLKLTTLKLNNNKLTIIKKHSFNALEQLIELHLHNNQIETLDPEAFVGLTNLDVLDLSNNKLKSIKEPTLRPLIALQRLYLNYNDLQQVPVLAVNSLPSLRQLQLTGNEMSDVPPRSFQRLSNLVTINLDKNRIGAVAQDAFYGLTSLSFLSLADNRLPYVPGRSFQNLANLTGLDLSGNMFQLIDQHSLPLLPKLTHLRIGRSPRLVRVQANAFQRVVAIESLDLSQNARLTHIEDQALSVLLNLKELDLTACSLIYIDPNQIPRAHNTKLHLAGNPLHCNCSLLWLVKLPLNGSISVQGPTCASPPKYHGMSVRDIDLHEAGCSMAFSWPAIAICVGVVVVGMLIIGIFLATRSNCTSPIPPCKTIPRDNVPRTMHLPPQYPPPPPFHSQSLYGPKMPPPPAFSPSVRPLLQSPTPSPTQQALLPADWMYPGPYDDETHWYSTVGKNGLEYLTGDLPPPLSRPPIPPPPTDRLKRNPSLCSRPSPALSSRIYHDRTLNNHQGPPLDSRGLPITYI